MNWRDTKMRGPRPSVGRVNRDYDSDGPGAVRYGRSGTEGHNYYNSYTNPRPNTETVICIYTSIDVITLSRWTLNPRL